MMLFAPELLAFSVQVRSRDFVFPPRNHGRTDHKTRLSFRYGVGPCSGVPYWPSLCPSLRTAAVAPTLAHP